MSSQSNAVNENTTIAESFVRANIVPNESLVASIKEASRRQDWAGRVIANVDISRHPIRSLISGKKDFESFRSFAVKQIVDKLGKGFFISISNIEVEEKTKVKYILKVRVAKMTQQERTPAPKKIIQETTPAAGDTSVADVAPAPQERPKPVAEVRPKALLNNKNAFALLCADDSDNE